MCWVLSVSLFLALALCLPLCLFVSVRAHVCQELGGRFPLDCPLQCLFQAKAAAASVGGAGAWWRRVLGSPALGSPRGGVVEMCLWNEAPNVLAKLAGRCLHHCICGSPSFSCGVVLGESFRFDGRLASHRFFAGNSTALGQLSKANNDCSGSGGLTQSRSQPRPSPWVDTSHVVWWFPLFAYDVSVR